MRWFSKKNNKKNLSSSPSLPKIQDVPKLPKLPKIENDLDDLPKLPSYPSDPLGKKFSDSTIKNIVSGEKLGDREVFDADESFPDNKGMLMQRPLPRLTQEIDSDDLPEIENKKFSTPKTKEVEPVFVRMDKFEESLEIFDKARKKLEEIEKFIDEIKHIREREESELRDWESEMQTIKSQFEKINRNLFSKI